MPKKVWVPYEEAHDWALRLHIRSYKEWLEVKKPDNIPNHPHMAYRNSGFTGWNAFLGTGRTRINSNHPLIPYEEAHEWVVANNVLSAVDYRNRKRDGLLPPGLPTQPEFRYVGHGWKSWSAFLKRSKRGSRSQPDIWIEHGLLQIFGAEYVSHRVLRFNDGVLWPDVTISGWKHQHPNNGVLIEYDGWFYHHDKHDKDAANLAKAERNRYFTIRIREPGLRKIGPFDLENVKNPQNDRNKVLAILCQIVRIIVETSMVPPDLLTLAEEFLRAPRIDVTPQLLDDVRGRYVSFDEARTWATSLNLSGAREWKIWILANQLPHGVPRGPHRVYAGKGWQSWPNFLGNEFVSYEQASAWAKSQSIHSISQWRRLTDKRPDNIPAAPYLAYKNGGWTNWGDFLGTGSIAPKLKVYASYEEASAWAQSQGIKTRTQWDALGRKNLPEEYPTNPSTAYSDKWTDWPDFLGTRPGPGLRAKRSPRKSFLSYEEASAWAQREGVRTKEQWCSLTREALPSNLPSHPDRAYAAEWKGWPDFLGTRPEPGMAPKRPSRKKFASYEEASAWAQREGVRSQLQWRALGRERLPDEYPSHPNDIYVNEWKGWNDFLGTTPEPGMPLWRGPKRTYALYEDASAWARQEGIVTKTQWCALKREELPEKFPSHPDRAYADKWKGWPSFLGNHKKAR